MFLQILIEASRKDGESLKTRQKKVLGHSYIFNTCERKKGKSLLPGGR